jgi:hypothetical protein
MINHEATNPRGKSPGPLKLLPTSVADTPPTSLISEDIFCTMVKSLKTSSLDKMRIRTALFGATTAR